MNNWSDNFCSYCGRELEKTVDKTKRFHSRTGEPMKEYRYVCPMSKNVFSSAYHTAFAYVQRELPEGY